MLDDIRGIAQLIVLLYVVAAMVVVGLTKVGGAVASITKTSYVSESHREINGWSRQTKILHLALFIMACIVAFWPAGLKM